MPLIKTLSYMSVSCLLLASCDSSNNQQTSKNEYSFTEVQNDQLLTLMTEYKSPSMAVGVIKDSKLVWTKYFGNRSPGRPVDAETMFNTASVQKAVTSEAVIHLVEKGLIDLDEPLSAHYVHPDVADDPRHKLLTPRIVLTHKTGFLNWPYEYDDGRLSFVSDPGTTYGYSGIGFMIMAHAIENKLAKPWPKIVRDEIFDPLGMSNASVVQETWMTGKYVTPATAEGTLQTDFTLELGYWNAADDLYVTVEDYAKFLIGVAENKGVGEKLSKERVRVQSDLTENEIWGCDGIVDPCPAPFGHGLGWFVFGYDGVLNIQHGGNDQSEAAIGYIEPQTGNGAIVFVNSTQGVLLWPRVVEVIDKNQQFTAVFNHVIDKFLTPKKDVGQ